MTEEPLESLLDRAWEFRAANRPDLAKRFVERALERDPCSSRALSEMCTCLVALEDCERAIEYGRAAVAMAPGYAYGHYALAKAHYATGAWDEALAAASEALRLDPNYEWYHNGVGLIREARKEFDLALTHYESALALAPDVAYFHVNRSDALRRLGRTEEAREAAEAARRLAPGFAFAHEAVAAAHEASGDIESARECFAEALRLAPDRARVRKGLLRTTRARFLPHGLIARVDRALSARDRERTAAGLVSSLGTLGRRRALSPLWSWFRHAGPISFAHARMRWGREGASLMSRDDVVGVDRLVRRSLHVAALAAAWLAGWSVPSVLAAVSWSTVAGAVLPARNCDPSFRRPLMLYLTFPFAAAAGCTVAVAAQASGPLDPEFVQLHVWVWSVTAIVGAWIARLVALVAEYPWSHRFDED